MKLRYSVCSVVVFVGLFLQSVAAADYGIAFVFGETNYMVAPSGTVDVNVYLRETVTGGDTGVLDMPGGGDGLIGAGVKVYFDDSPRPSDPAKVLSALDIAYNSSDFEAGFGKSVGSGYADLSEATFGSAVYGAEDPTGVFRVLLGTLTFTAGSVLGEVTPIRATDYNPATEDIVTGGMVALDALIIDGTATITTTPEPSTLALLGSGLLCLLALGRRQLRGSRRSQ